jgi:hypothetical protein
MHEIIGGITFVLQRRDDGQTLAVLEEAENFAAPRRHTIRIDEAERAPGVNRRSGTRFAVGGAVSGMWTPVSFLHDDAALLRRKEEASVTVLIRHHLHGERSKQANTRFSFVTVPMNSGATS